MEHKQASFWRKFWLILVIITGAFAVFCGWKAYSINQNVIAYALLPALVFVLVLILEVLSVLVNRKTLSTNVTKSIEQYEKSRIWIYLTLASMVLVLLFLAPHLFITG